MMTVKAEIKLIDFGLCGDARMSPLLRGMVGSPYWMPPEMIRGQPHSYPVDAWSAGICLLELCNGHAPKMGNAFRSMFSTGAGIVPPLKTPDAWSMCCHEFFARMLEIDAAKRASPDELLAHEFLRNKDKVASRADMRKKLTEIFQAGAIVNAGFG
jgi:serine/threonine protein kinase